MPWGGLAVLILCAMLSVPILDLCGAPHSVAVQAHLTHTLELSEALKANVLYPRWAADLNYGFGSPIFNYVAPLPRYLSALYYLLVQENLIASYHFALISAILLNGAGLYAFARSRWGGYEGLIAAGTFLLSIPVFHSTIHAVGDIPLLLATGAFACALYALERLARDADGVSLILASAAVGLVWISDSPLNVLLVTTLGIWILLFYPRDVRARAVTHPLSALILGTLLGSFYLIPAWGEQDAAAWYAFSPAGPVKAAISVWELFAPAPPIDLSAATPDTTLRLGPAVLILSAATAVWMLTRAWMAAPSDGAGGTRGDRLQQRLMRAAGTLEVKQWGAVFFLVAGGLAAIAAATNFTEVLGGDRPWTALTTRDLLLFSGLCFSIWIGQLGSLTQTARAAWMAVGGMALAAAAIALSAAFSVLPLSRQISVLPEDINDWARGSVRGYFASADPDGMLLPRDLPQPADPIASLIDSYEAGYLNVDKVSRASLPAAVFADVITHSSNTDRLIVNTSTPTAITLLTYDFPGWQAKINGQPAAIRSNPNGFIMIRIPPGRHEVEVAFASTPLRLTAWGISIITGIVLLTLALRQEASPSATTADNRAIPGDEPLSHGVMIAGIIVLWGAAFSMPFLARPYFTQQSPPGTVLEAKHPFPRQLQGGIDLLAYDLSAPAIVSQADQLQVTLYWRAVRPDLPDYQANIALLSANDETTPLVQRRHLAQIPTSQWSRWPLLTTYFEDTYNLSIPSGLAPGTYRIEVLVGQCTQAAALPCPTIDPLFVRDPRGTSLGTTIVLPEVVRVAGRE